jgi:membrane associated rhomboid family serine protease
LVVVPLAAFLVRPLVAVPLAAFLVRPLVAVPSVAFPVRLVLVHPDNLQVHHVHNYLQHIRCVHSDLLHAHPFQVFLALAALVASVVLVELHFSQLLLLPPLLVQCLFSILLTLFTSFLA